MFSEVWSGNSDGLLTIKYLPIFGIEFSIASFRYNTYPISVVLTPLTMSDRCGQIESGNQCRAIRRCIIHKIESQKKLRVARISLVISARPDC